MSRKSKVHYQLNDLQGQIAPCEEDIRNILRAADEIIFVAGRTMLAKILKGSKDKRLLEKELDHCPSYGYYSQLSIEEITKIIDWMIVHNYLDIDYNGRLPMVIFSKKGWETYKPFYVDELYNYILNVNETICNDIIEQLKQTNREVVRLLLLEIRGARILGL